MTEPVIKGVFYMADEMLAAGVKELKHTPKKEDPSTTVARIYTAMEVVRLLMEHVLEHEGMTPEQQKLRLN